MVWFLESIHSAFIYRPLDKEIEIMKSVRCAVLAVNQAPRGLFPRNQGSRADLLRFVLSSVFFLAARRSCFYPLNCGRCSLCVWFVVGSQHSKHNKSDAEINSILIWLLQPDTRAAHTLSEMRCSQINKRDVRKKQRLLVAKWLGLERVKLNWISE